MNSVDNECRIILEGLWEQLYNNIVTPEPIVRQGILKCIFYFIDPVARYYLFCIRISF